MTEKDIEIYFCKEIGKRKGKAYKFISPTANGVPDRIVLAPGGKIAFVELKAPGKKPRKLQLYTFKQFEKLGFKVEVIDSFEKVDKFVDVMFNAI